MGSDFCVFNKKMQFNRRVNSAYFPRLNKKTTYAQIVNSRCIFRSAAPLEGPHALRSFNAFVVSSLALQISHMVSRPSRLCIFQLPPIAKEQGTKLACVSDSPN
jgi:hypothetical protein